MIDREVKLAVDHLDNTMEETITTIEEIMELSLEKFRWKTSGQFDQLADLLDDTFQVVSPAGQKTSRAEWLLQLTSNSFCYHKIEPQDHSVAIYGQTAVLVGFGWFTLNDGIVHKLIYTEVYIKKNEKWKLVNLHSTSYE